MNDTICAIATAPGRGGVGIVRVSGPLAKDIGCKSIHSDLSPRLARLADFFDHNNDIIDQGIALFFPNPHSFTGEDVFEFQGHGGPVILDMIIEQCLLRGARLARPGEFSERAFLNDKMDLTQAEAIADLIDANSRQAALQASNSLQGQFSNEINRLFDAVTQLRLYVESAIDFPEEEIDFLADDHISQQLHSILQQVNAVQLAAKQGSVMREGMRVVLAGKPNAGKSTLLNALAEQELAIVTDIPGTTRDALSTHIHIDGMPLHITDTAGLRKTEDKVERIGIERAWEAIDSADRILLLVDATSLNINATNLSECFHNNDDDALLSSFMNNDALRHKLTLIVTKTDLASQQYTHLQTKLDTHVCALSAKTKEGLAELKQHLLHIMGIEQATEGLFSARRRHLDALNRALDALKSGQVQLEAHAAGELLAEDLRLAQENLGEITGKLSADDLLGKIFSSFCIGK